MFQSVDRIGSLLYDQYLNELLTLNTVNMPSLPILVPEDPPASTSADMVKRIKRLRDAPATYTLYYACEAHNLLSDVKCKSFVGIPLAMDGATLAIVFPLVKFVASILKVWKIDDDTVWRCLFFFFPFFLCCAM